MMGAKADRGSRRDKQALGREWALSTIELQKGMEYPMTAVTSASGNDHDLERRLDYLGLDTNARKELRSLKPFLERELAPALDRFYRCRSQEPGDQSPFFQ